MPRDAPVTRAVFPASLVMGSPRSRQPSMPRSPADGILKYVQSPCPVPPGTLRHGGRKVWDIGAASREMLLKEFLKHWGSARPSSLGVLASRGLDSTS